jgi:hypothetical protein
MLRDGDVPELDGTARRRPLTHPQPVVVNGYAFAIGLGEGEANIAEVGRFFVGLALRAITSPSRLPVQ